MPKKNVFGLKLDPYTLRRLKREKKCFDASHEEERVSLLSRIEAQAKKISDLEQREGELQSQISKKIDQDVADEAVKRAFSEGLHEGGKIAREAVEKENLCLNKIHQTFIGDKKPMLLHLGEILSMIALIVLRGKDAGIVGPMMPRILVMVPEGIGVTRMDEDMSMKFVKDVFTGKTSHGILGNARGKKEGGI